MSSFTPVTDAVISSAASSNAAAATASTGAESSSSDGGRRRIDTSPVGPVEPVDLTNHQVCDTL